MLSLICPLILQFIQGHAIRQIFSCPDHFSLTYMTRKGRGRYRKPPLRMRVSVYVWHSNVSSCCILGFIGITLGSQFGLSSYEACDPSRDWRMQFFLICDPSRDWRMQFFLICDPKCDLKEIRVCNKNQLLFGLMALPIFILSLSTWNSSVDAGSML